jgi:hypothetical protein
LVFIVVGTIVFVFDDDSVPTAGGTVLLSGFCDEDDGDWNGSSVRSSVMVGVSTLSSLASSSFKDGAAIASGDK